MAVNFKFVDVVYHDSSLEVRASSDLINVFGTYKGHEFDFLFDTSTAIKFAKTLRTEINKAKEVGNE